MTETLFDCIVAGSGPSGVMCAQTLVESGKKVLLIDAGLDVSIDNSGSGENYIDIRRTKDRQEDIFLGKNLELLNLDAEKAFGQMTPQRKYVVDDSKYFLRVLPENFAPVESLATGGLGNAWGLGCFTFSDAELLKAKLDPIKIKKAYQVIADRIGISYTQDDISNYTAAGLESLQPGIEVDSNAKAILKRYHSRRTAINNHFFYSGVPALALLTRNKGDRHATDYTNMDFYYNPGEAAYRPTQTITSLLSNSQFVHQRGVFVTRFEEQDNIVHVAGTDMNTNQPIHFRGRKLVLACNVFGSARIVLRSLGRFQTKLPLLCNPLSHFAMLQWRQLGKVPSKSKTSTVQVCLFHDEDRAHANVSMASLYSYSSLMLFRLLKKSPLNYRDAIYILKYLQSAIVIAGIHHPSTFDDSRYVCLENDDKLRIHYSNTPEEERNIASIEKRFVRVLKKLGCLPFKKILPPAGSSSHYAGTFPFSEERSPLSLSPEGLLAGTQHVYVADASGFCYLPAKGPTLTIMANAHNVALNIIKDDE